MPKVSESYRVERRERILLAAARCFADRGFHMTSMDDVIAAAGLSAGAVYGYYRGKDELIRAVAERAMELARGVVPAVVAEARSPAELVERVLGLVEDLAGQVGFDPTRVAVQAWAEAVRTPAMREIAGAAYRELRADIAGAVPGWQRGGAVAADADPDEVAKVLFGLLPGYIVQRQLLGDVRPDRYGAALRALTPGSGG